MPRSVHAKKKIFEDKVFDVPRQFHLGESPRRVIQPPRLNCPQEGIYYLSWPYRSSQRTDLLSCLQNSLTTVVVQRHLLAFSNSHVTPVHAARISFLFRLSHFPASLPQTSHTSLQTRSSCYRCLSFASLGDPRKPHNNEPQAR